MELKLNKINDLNYTNSNDDLHKAISDYLARKYNGACNFEYIDNGENVRVYNISHYERDVFSQACEDFAKLQNDFAGLSFEECLNKISNDSKTYGITNKTEEFVDFNYGVGCFTIFNEDSKGDLADSIEVWDDLCDACYGIFTLEECKQQARG